MIVTAQFFATAHLLLQHPWIFAKTMPENPHWYTLRKQWKTEEQFVQVVETMRANGYKEKYKASWYTMFDVNEHKYWTMGAPVPQTILINRKVKAVQSPYDALAASYDALFQDAESQAENQQVIAALPTPIGKVLDIGCGTGVLLDYVQPTAYRGIDPAAAMLAKLHEKHPAYADQTCCTHFEDFYTTERYDTILGLFGTPNYILPDALDRIRDFLRPGGQFFLMFFQPGYVPLTYQRSGIVLPHYHYDPSLAGRLQADVRPCGNFLVLTGGV